MNIYSRFIDPESINCSIGCNFISPKKKNLIVTRTSILQIFDIVEVDCKNNNLNDTEKKKQNKLKLLDQFILHGNITDLKAIKTVENPNLDYLIVSSRHAKFSLIKWNHELLKITTVSLHYYENAIQKHTFENLSISELMIDPTYNSHVCLRNKNILFFLTFESIEDLSSDCDNEKNNEALNRHILEKKNELKKIFNSSIMLTGTNLDPSIENIIDLQFMHNCREPTLAIIYLKSHTWTGTLPILKDNILFIVLTIDLDTKSTVSVLRIDNLPYDIDRIFSLSLPLNGCLLLGSNQIFHVDIGGIVRKIFINEFSSIITNLTKNHLDQSNLSLFLEKSLLMNIPNSTKILMILKTGDFYYINFELDGKTIKKIIIESIDKSLYPNINLYYPRSFSCLDNNLFFFNAKSGNNFLVEFKYSDTDSNIKPKEEKEHENQKKKDEVDNFNKSNLSLNDIDEDDFYQDDEVCENVKYNNSEIEFIIHDELINTGPMSSFTLGHFSIDKYKSNLPNPNYKEICIVSSSGLNINGSINIFTPTINPVILSSLKFSHINKMWIINRKFLITSDDLNSKSEIFKINQSFTKLIYKDFITNELTLLINEMNNGKFILQITPTNVILYNGSFKKIFSMVSELENCEIINCTVKDDLLMIFTSNGDVLIYFINTYNGSFKKIEIPNVLNDVIITNGYIANSSLLNAVLNQFSSENTHETKNDIKSDSENFDFSTNNSIHLKQKIFIVITGDNRLVAFNKHHDNKCYEFYNIRKFTDILSLNLFDQKQTYPDPFIKQIIFNELGDEFSQDEYLTILTVSGEIILYKLYFNGEIFILIKEKDLSLTGTPENLSDTDNFIERNLVYFPNLSNYTCIFVTGVTPYLIIKTTHSIPHIFKFSKLPIVSVASFCSSKVKNGVITLDNEKSARICKLPSDFNYENKWPKKIVHIGELINSIVFHESSNTYIISTVNEEFYNCTDEENNPIVGVNTTKLSSLSYKGSVKLISSFNWTIIDSIDLENNEVCTCIKSMILDVGSQNKKQKVKKEFVVFGTGKFRIEDLSANGSFRILEIIEIIPEPGKPETNHKFKNIFKEDTRGVVSSLCDVGGRFLLAQGQKVIVRDLQDDSVIPVAFLDTSVYVAEAKSFGNLLIIGDALKNVWLVGFDAEPYRMIVLGKHLLPLNINCADFITRDDEIFILLCDNNNVLNLIQYDPEDPSSLNGQRLINKSFFSLTSLVSCFRSIPKLTNYNNDKADQLYEPNVDFQIIGSTIDGAFFTVFPTNESTYRRMYLLQQQLIDKEHHYCGLNPRSNRSANISNNINERNMNPILDHDVIKSFFRLSDDKKKNFASKVCPVSMYLDMWKDLIEIENSLKFL